MNKRPTEIKLPLSKAEAKRIADVCLQYGDAPDRASSTLTSDAFARRMKKRTGKSPAKVYSIKGRK